MMKRYMATNFVANVKSKGLTWPGLVLHVLRFFFLFFFFFFFFYSEANEKSQLVTIPPSLPSALLLLTFRCLDHVSTAISLSLPLSSIFLQLCRG